MPHLIQRKKEKEVDATW